MKKNELRIIFMGTPRFAVESLQALVENGYNVVGVVTMPDKPAGRGYRLQPSAVKQYAEQQGLNVLQPVKMRDPSFLEELRSLRADLQIVVAFRMLPEVVWNMPSRGTFNLHASLLPQYRGAAPINRVIINGEQETGVTTFLLTHQIDTGSILFREKTPVSDDDNAGTLHDRLMLMGAGLVLKTTDAILTGSVTPISQDQLLDKEPLPLKEAPKIFKEECRISWQRPLRELFNFIRGLSPSPAAWTELLEEDGGKPLRFKLFDSEMIEDDKVTAAPGRIITDNDTVLDVAVCNGYLRIKELQMSGKKRMSSREFLRGYAFPEDARFF